MRQVYRQLAENYDMVRFGFAFDKEEFIRTAKQPTTILKKGELYDETTSYQFEVIK